MASGEVDPATWGPPKPGNKPADYTRKRVQKAYKYSQTFVGPNASRKASPITEKLLQMYANACEVYLDEGATYSKEEHEEAAAELQDYESKLARNVFLKQAGWDEKKRHRDLIDPIKRLRQLDLYIRYGDYAAKICSELRNKAEMAKIPGREHFGLQAKWIVVRDQLRSERPEWELLWEKIKKEPRPRLAVPTSEERARAPTLAAIWETCTLYMGYDWQQMVKLIEIYATRNSIAHLHLDSLLASGVTHVVAQRLHDDWADLDLTFSWADEAEKAVLKFTIREVINAWFEIPEGDFYNPATWHATRKLKDEMLKKRHGSKAVPSARDDRSRREIEDMAEKFAAKFKEDDEEKALLSLLEESAAGLNKLPDPEAVGVRKRKASSGSSSSAATRAKRRNQADDWDKAMNKYDNAYKTWQAGKKELAKKSYTELNIARSFHADYNAHWGESRERPGSSSDPPAAGDPPVVPARGASLEGMTSIPHHRG